MDKKLMIRSAFATLILLSVFLFVTYEKNNSDFLTPNPAPIFTLSTKNSPQERWIPDETVTDEFLQFAVSQGWISADPKEEELGLNVLKSVQTFEGVSGLYLFKIGDVYRGTYAYFPVARKEGKLINADTVIFSDIRGAAVHAEFSYKSKGFFIQNFASHQKNNSELPVDCKIERYGWNSSYLSFEKYVGSEYTSMDLECPVPYKRIFASNNQITKQDMIDFLADENEYIEIDHLSDIQSYKDYPFFVFFVRPAGPSGDEYIPFYINNGKLKKANISFVTAGLAGVWAGFGYNKEKDFFYQSAGTPSSYTPEKGTPCRFEKYIWDTQKLEFSKRETVNFYSTKDDFCSDKFADYGIKPNPSNY